MSEKRRINKERRAFNLWWESRHYDSPGPYPDMKKNINTMTLIWNQMSSIEKAPFFDNQPRFSAKTLLPFKTWCVKYWGFYAGKYPNIFCKGNLMSLMYILWSVMEREEKQVYISSTGMDSLRHLPFRETACIFWIRDVLTKKELFELENDPITVIKEWGYIWRRMDKKLKVQYLEAVKITVKKPQPVTNRSDPAKKPSEVKIVENVKKESDFPKTSNETWKNMTEEDMKASIYEEIMADIRSFEKQAAQKAENKLLQDSNLSIKSRTSKSKILSNLDLKFFKTAFEFYLECKREEVPQIGPQESKQGFRSRWGRVWRHLSYVEKYPIVEKHGEHLKDFKQKFPDIYQTLMEKQGPRRKCTEKEIPEGKKAQEENFTTLSEKTLEIQNVPELKTVEVQKVIFKENVVPCEAKTENVVMENSCNLQPRKRPNSDLPEAPPKKVCKGKARKAEKRPMQAFQLFLQQKRLEDPREDHIKRTQRWAPIWNMMSVEEKEPFRQEERRLMQIYREKYPEQNQTQNKMNRNDSTVLEEKKKKESSIISKILKQDGVSQNSGKLEGNLNLKEQEHSDGTMENENMSFGIRNNLEEFDWDSSKWMDGLQEESRDCGDSGISNSDGWSLDLNSGSFNSLYLNSVPRVCQEAANCIPSNTEAEKRKSQTKRLKIRKKSNEGPMVNLLSRASDSTSDYSSEHSSRSLYDFENMEPEDFSQNAASSSHYDSFSELGELETSMALEQIEPTLFVQQDFPWGGVQF